MKNEEIIKKGHVMLSTWKRQVDFIKQIVAEYYGSSSAIYDSKSQKREIIKVKYIAMWIVLQRVTGITLVEIGGAFGGRDHATVLHAKKVIGGYLSWDKELLEEVNEILSLVDHKLIFIDGRIDLEKDFVSVDLNNCIAIKEGGGKSIVFAGYSVEEVNDVLANLGVTEKTPIIFNNTAMYLLQKKEKEENEK